MVKVSIILQYLQQLLIFIFPTFGSNEVELLLDYCVKFLQSHSAEKHATKILEIAVKYDLQDLLDRCVEFIVTDDSILSSGDFLDLSESAILEVTIMPQYILQV